MTMTLPEWFYPGPPGGWTADMAANNPSAPTRGWSPPTC